MSTFLFFRYRFHFRAEGDIVFPAGQGANVIRGAFGWLLRETAGDAEYARLFEPAFDRGRESGKVTPSGLAEWPRPFVFRAAHLDGNRFAAGDGFWFDAHIFDVRHLTVGLFRQAFEDLAHRGLGPERGRAVLERVEQIDFDGVAATEAAGPLTVALEVGGPAVDRVKVEFVTPTELKSGGAVSNKPEFGILFARLRDRLSTLSSLYGEGPLDIDFRGMGERARSISLERSELQWVRPVRRSTRTGQSHAIGGFTGVAEYSGELREFLPFLKAARWVGVGRHTVWGNGELRVHSTRIAMENSIPA